MTVQKFLQVKFLLLAALFIFRSAVGAPLEELPSSRPHPNPLLRGEGTAEEITLSKADSVKRERIRREAPHFVPMPDRWRSIKLTPYELNVKGRLIDPYNQNVLKGDFPIIGQKTFFILTASTESFFEASAVPTPSAVSTNDPNNQAFFGDAERFFMNENLRLSFEFYHGNTAFRPRDFEIKATAAFNLNYLDSKENNDVNVNVQQGTKRYDDHFALQELFLEKHLFDLSAHYDFISFKGGIQPFKSDFRGFIFDDFNLGARLFGSAGSNRYQYNFAYFNLLEKDTNSELNTVFDWRDQEVFIFNLYKQDFLGLGYTGQISFHYNHDKPSVYVDENGAPVRPAVIGASQPHDIKAYYLGWAGDGHFGRLNVNHAFYQVLGKDTFNALAGRPIDICAQMAALELSIDKDWLRLRTSGFFSSGDPNPLDGVGQGFDTILDVPFFAGGPFSYWSNQRIRLLGVNLTNKLSLVPSLRPSKAEAQANFVNPGLMIANVGLDFDLTPKTEFVINANYIRFIDTSSLAFFLNQGGIRNDVGIDTGVGVLYRPFLNNNAVFTFSLSTFTPLGGFRDLYESSRVQFALFSSFVFTY